MATWAVRRQREMDLRPLFVYLEDHGIKQTWLATRLRMNKAKLTNIKTGLVIAPKGFVEIACAELGISPRELQGRPVRKRASA